MHKLVHIFIVLAAITTNLICDDEWIFINVIEKFDNKNYKIYWKNIFGKEIACDNHKYH